MKQAVKNKHCCDLKFHVFYTHYAQD